jgi:predicted outer membrane protein
MDNEKAIAISELGIQRAGSPEVKQFATQMVQDHRTMIGKLQKFYPRISTSNAPGAGTGPGVGEEGQRPGRTPPESGRPGGTPPGTPSEGARPGGTPPGTPPEGGRPGATPPGTPPEGGRPGSTPPEGGRQGLPPSEAPSEGAGRNPTGNNVTLDPVNLKMELKEQCLSSARSELEQKSGAEFDKCFMGMQVMEHVAAVDTLTVFQKRASPELAQTLTEALTTVQAHLEHARSLAKKLDGNRDAGTREGGSSGK